jgi:hypothetical protein
MASEKRKKKRLGGAQEMVDQYKATVIGRLAFFICSILL